MSGCKNIYSVNIVLNKLVDVLNKLKISLSDDENEEIFYDRFRTPVSVSDFKIDMINSNCKTNMTIDRRKLYLLLIKKRIKQYMNLVHEHV